MQLNSLSPHQTEEFGLEDMLQNVLKTSIKALCPNDLYQNKFMIGIHGSRERLPSLLLFRVSSGGPIDFNNTSYFTKASLDKISWLRFAFL